MMATPRVLFTIGLPVEVHTRLEDEARRSGTTKTAIILEALVLRLPRESKGKKEA